ncbi:MULTISPECIES: TonB-dependent siderophore receptor [unclassified Flavobacterium]|uniref:TonB-dependent receptor plug domain-containing protein n=1 Tax=unclassified Flavobacterium TaxID=196869 RepID=UPI0012914E75|nr:MULTISPECIES: TonB-dependent receptor [unclassified Flavobacterium]MQP52478.1 TonB-dependent receptor plug domain-containing protein [Flavobacterium sp. LMO9]MQP62548.1 TonB-dependent receptor plug domain-containing protein [Flavobacterium sp. LMO6]
MNKKFIGLSVFTLATAFAYAQESDTLKVTNLKEVVVSDTKFAQSKEKSGKIIEVITAQDLEAKKGQNLANVLSQVAGVEINGNQSFNGKNLGYYIRGGRNRQVAIYIDGVPVSDASGINIEYDLRLIPVEQIEKIEVMKGASSTLYGTGAATGVINITLKKSAKKEISGNAYINMGTQNTSETSKTSAQDFNQGLSVNGTINKVSYMTTLNSTETKGMSEAAGEDFEEDTFSRVNVLQKIGFKANDKLSFEFFGNYDRIKNTFDNSFDGFIANSDDLNNNSFSEQFRIGFLPKYKYNKGEFAINAGASTIDRVLNISNSWSGTIDNYNYSGRSASIDAFNKYNFSKQVYLVLGVQYQYFDMTQKDAYTDVAREGAKFNLLDPYANFVYNSNFGFNLNAGLRLNFHSEYDTYYVLNINPSYTFKNLPLKILGSISGGYITPSLYQLYGPYGNLGLTPEENATAEFGFESQLLDKKLTINAVGFYREEENTFGFYYNSATFESYYINIDGTYNAKGVEASVRYTLSERFNIGGNYTFTQVEKQLNRLIPKHKGNVDVSYLFKRGTFGIQYQYVDQRNDAFYNSNIWATQAVDLSAYKLVNSNISYELLPNRLQVFGAVTNILNEDFQEIIGYNTRGRNYKLGLNFMF